MTLGESYRHSELGPGQENLVISHDSLREANHSRYADKRRDHWYKTRSNKGLTKIRLCGDSRGILPEPDEEIVVKCIAGGDTTPAESIIESPGIKDAVVMTHLDGDTVAPGVPPEGCSGLAVKKNHARHGKSDSKIDNYADRHISHPDPIIQACMSAEEMAGTTEKPVLAAVQNHRDGTIYPLAVFSNFAGRRYTHPKIAKMLKEHIYIPEDLYEEGLPTITEDEASQFADFMNQSRRRVITLKESYPNLYEESKIQNPPLIVLSTSLIPFPTRFPRMGDKPGTVFEVFVPRTRMGSSIRITPDDLRPSLEQMEFPVKASLDNHGQEGKSFAGTNTILIDTEQMAFSGALALSFVRQEQWISKWLSLPNHKILVSETTEGVITGIRELTPEDFSRIAY